jgi:hypothetical protein
VHPFCTSRCWSFAAGTADSSNTSGTSTCSNRTVFKDCYCTNISGQHNSQPPKKTHLHASCSDHFGCHCCDRHLQLLLRKECWVIHQPTLHAWIKLDVRKVQCRHRSRAQVCVLPPCSRQRGFSTAAVAAAPAAAAAVTAIGTMSSELCLTSKFDI